MLHLAGSLSATRIVGITADVFALSACATAWTKGYRTHRRTRLAAALTLLEAALLLDLMSNTRWLLHDVLAKAAIAHHLYSERSGPQLVALGLLVFAVVAGMGLVVWLFRYRLGAALATCGGLLSVCFWCTEVISLHAVDSVLYRRVDGVTLVRLAGAAFALMTGVGILLDAVAVRASGRTGARPSEGPLASVTT